MEPYGSLLTWVAFHTGCARTGDAARALVSGAGAGAGGVFGCCQGGLRTLHHHRVYQARLDGKPRLGCWKLGARIFVLCAFAFAARLSPGFPDLVTMSWVHESSPVG